MMKLRAVISIITFAVVIICAVVAYNIISSQYSPEIELVMAPELSAAAEQTSQPGQSVETGHSGQSGQSELSGQSSQLDEPGQSEISAQSEQTTQPAQSGQSGQPGQTGQISSSDQLTSTEQPVQSTQPTTTEQPSQGDSPSGDGELQAAPDFGMEDWNGNNVTLSELISNGKPIVLNFWASWCPPCKSEMPEFEKVFQDLGDEIQFIMLDVTDGQRETRAIGEQFINDQGYTFPVFFDSWQEASLAYGIRYIPTTIFINRDGYMVAGAQSAIDESILLQGIEMITTGT